MFARTQSENRKLSSKTTPICRRSECSCTSRTSWPSMHRAGGRDRRSAGRASPASICRCRSARRCATRSPAATCRSNPASTGRRCRSRSGRRRRSMSPRSRGGRQRRVRRRLPAGGRAAGRCVRARRAPAGRSVSTPASCRAGAISCVTYVENARNVPSVIWCCSASHPPSARIATWANVGNRLEQRLVARLQPDRAHLRAVHGLGGFGERSSSRSLLAECLDDADAVEVLVDDLDQIALALLAVPGGREDPPAHPVGDDEQRTARRQR